MQSKKCETVDQYIAQFPDSTQELLQGLRKIIKNAAPKADESISYNMPAYKYHGILVYFGAAKNHIGFYPTASPVIAFKKELEKYATSKGAIQFPMDKKIPAGLVRDIVKFKVLENLEKESVKKKSK